MLRKLLIQKLRPLQLVIASSGTLLGFLMLIVATQVYFLFNEILNQQKDVLGNQYMVIQKKISLLNTFSISNSSFSNEEIKEINQLTGIKNTAGFRSNLFQANAFIEKGANNLIPQLYTDLFFESVPNDFIDISNRNWNWPGNDSAVPLILPKDYLNLYNFGFAPGQNLPQISESTIEMLRFKIRIRGKGKEKVFYSFIAGFSNRINSILVPENFLKYANTEFGEKESAPPSRLIIATNDPSQAQLLDYFKQKGIETNEDALKSGKLNALLNVMVSILMIVGSVIILLAVMNIIQYAQLLITQSDYEIRTLILLGYNYKSLLLYYGKMISFLMILLGSIGFVVLHLLNQKIISFLSEKGYETESGIYSGVFACGIIILTAVCLASFLLLRKQIQKIAIENSGKKN
jgi:hypothetical protein